MSVKPLWTQLTVDVPREHGEAIANFLFDHGSSGLEEQAHDERVLLKAYFSVPPPLTELKGYAIEIGAFAPDKGEPHSEALSVSTVDEEDWAETWRYHFVPLLIGKRLFVCPPWTEERPADRITIAIDPGMAFGTGQHATTRMCLELLESVVLEHAVATALDLGSGSGILSIALAKLGVPNVWAIEIDPLAREATMINAESNDVGPAITTAATLAEAPYGAALVVANLYTTLLIELAPAIAERVVPGGSMVCSGFVEGDVAQIEAAIRAAGFHRRERRSEAPWAALVFERL